MDGWMDGRPGKFAAREKERVRTEGMNGWRERTGNDMEKHFKGWV